MYIGVFRERPTTPRAPILTPRSANSSRVRPHSTWHISQLRGFCVLASWIFFERSEVCVLPTESTPVTISSPSRSKGPSP